MLGIFLFSSNVHAYDFEVDGVYYNVTSEENFEVCVTYKALYKDTYEGNINIPSSVSYQNRTYSVTAIDEYSFYNCDSLKSVIIPNTITSIGRRAFEYSDGISSITIPNSVTSIGYEAFMDCSNLEIVISEIQSPFTISDDVFKNYLGYWPVVILQVPTGLKDTYKQTTGWNSNFRYIVEENIELYRLTLNVTGNGQGTIDSDKYITNDTDSKLFPEGVDNVIRFYPDKDHHIKQVKVNDVDVTSDVGSSYGNPLTIHMSSDMTVDAEFVETKIYNLSVAVSDYGNVHLTSTGRSSISANWSNSTKTYSVKEGTTISLRFTPNHGYQLKSVKINNSDVTSDIVDNNYNIENLSADTSIEVEFVIKSYALSIKSTGNGIVSYGDTQVKNDSCTIYVDHGNSATISIIPDDGYRVKKMVIDNNNNWASLIKDNKYTIENIYSDKKVEVEFEAIPTTTYTLSIQATGNGTISYDNTSIKNKTASFTVNEGSSATITLTPDDGYRIKSLTVNYADVKAGISNNQYTISNISTNTNVVAEFEAIPTTTYTLSIQATGNGTVSYNDTAVKNKTTAFTVNEGGNATITLSADDGYRVKSLTVNNKDVKASISNNQYTISNISSNTNVVAEFEAIPETKYTLTIKAIGNGTISFNSTSIRNSTKSFSLAEGSVATISFIPDNGYRVKNMTIDGKDKKADISNNQYAINSIFSDINIEVEFEAVPETKYTLTIKSIGNGSVTYETTSTREKTSTFSVAEGASATITLEPDGGHLLKSLVVNGTDVTASVVGNQYTISSINANVTVEVEFKAIETITSDGIEYKVTSIKQKSVVVAKGDYGQCIKVPDTVSAYDDMWAVTGFEEGALETATELAAVIWNPQTRFEEKVTNPNLLLYVKSADYAPADIKNVIVNSKAKSITLTDAASGNNFYCPEEFTAEQITYEHNYSMKTGYSTCQGWETIVLPFDVAVVNNNIGTELVPYSLWTRGDSKRPFWLYSMNEDGWQAESAIVANTPYIISMPNNDNYDATYNISGNIVFSASNATVQASENLTSSKHGHRNLVPNYQNRDSNPDIYALNVNNLWDQNTDSGLAEGSAFVRGSRQTRPFEAYMTIDSGSATTRSIGIFDDDNTTGIMSLPLADSCNDGVIRVYSISGVLLKEGSDEKVIDELPKGIYVVNGKKIIK